MKREILEAVEHQRAHAIAAARPHVTLGLRMEGEIEMAISGWFAPKANVDSEIRDMVAVALSGCNALGTMGFAAPFPSKWQTLRELLQDREKQNITGAYVFGFFDYLGQARGLSEEVIIATAKESLKKGLSISVSCASDLATAGVVASRTERGREIIKAGGMAIADFLEYKKPPFGRKFTEALLFGMG